MRINRLSKYAIALFLGLAVSNSADTLMTAKANNYMSEEVFAVENVNVVNFKAGNSKTDILEEKVIDDADEKEPEEIKIKLIFNTNGGMVSMKKKQVVVGKKVGKLPTPTKEGYEFLGWYTKKTGGKIIDKKTVVKYTKNKKIYAHWKPIQYKIKYYRRGGNFSKPVSREYNIEQKVKLKKPEREGYVFGGWYTSKKLKKRVKCIEAGSMGDKNFYAKWTPISYTLSFDANGGKGKMSELTCDYNKEFTMPECSYVNDNMKFVAWNTAADGSGKSYNVGDLMKNMTSQSETITLYAIWQRYEVTVVPYSDTVNKGEVRYVSQLMEDEDFNFGAWGGHAWAAIGECGYCCQSMALSYIGKNIPPSYLLEGESYGYWYTAYSKGNSEYNIDGIEATDESGAVDGATGSKRIEKMFKRFNSDQFSGNVSPVVVHYMDYNSGNEHCILLVKRNKKGSYVALDPAEGNRKINIKIYEDGSISGDITFANGYIVVDAVQQYISVETEGNNTTEN